MLIVITGAGRGIGLELTKQLAARGDHVIAACRAPTPALAAIPNVEIVKDVDVTSDVGASRLTDAVGTRLIDVLVCNAGILEPQSGSPSLGFDLDSIRRQMEVNALGPLRITAALLRNMGAGAKIALLSSRAGSIGDNSSGGLYGYRMSKAALNMAAMSLTRDLADRGVLVCVLHPGFVKTDMTAGSGSVEPKDAARGLIARVDGLTKETSGTFWHASGEVLPW